MPVFARHLLPVVDRRRRPKHLPGGGVPPEARTKPRAPSSHTFEPPSPARALAIIAHATVRRAGRPLMRPTHWDGQAFAREVELIRGHLRPIRSRPVLAASFGREAFHGDPSGSGDGSGAVTVAYAIRWLELGDRHERPRWDAWLAESAATPSAPLAVAATSAVTD